MASKGRGSLAQCSPSSALSQLFPISAAFAPTPVALTPGSIQTVRAFLCFPASQRTNRNSFVLPDPLSVKEPSVLTCTSGQFQAMEVLPTSHGLCCWLSVVWKSMEQGWGQWASAAGIPAEPWVGQSWQQREDVCSEKEQDRGGCSGPDVQAALAQINAGHHRKSPVGLLALQ